MTRVVLLRRWRRDHSALDASIRAAGYDLIVASDETFDPAAGDVVWINGNVNWFPRTRSILKKLSRATRPRTMVWHSEPLPFPRGSGFPQPRLQLREIAKIALRDHRATDAYTNFRRIGELYTGGVLDLCVVTSRSRQAFLRERDIPSAFVPLGYYPGLGTDLGITRDIDVLFLGAHDDSRHRRAIRYLRSSGISVEAHGSWTSAATWGDSRTQLINRAKIFLNIQRHAGQYSGLRMLLGMGNRTMVLSEPVYDPFPYEPGVHYVSTSLDTMPETILKYLSDESARSAIADAGHRFVTQELTLEKSVNQVLHHMEEMLHSRSSH
ncbi:MAG TPA: glycosyltransferase [Gemmatimonadaceae bacterium]